MSSDRQGRAVDAALTAVVASLAAWGVRDGHWLPDRDGSPVVWLRTATEAQRRALQSQVWLLPQVQVTLTRLEVAHEVVWRLRLEITSAEAETALFDE